MTVEVTEGVVGPTYYLSFTSTTSVPGLGSVRDEDIVTYDAAAGTWATYFDGSDVGVTADLKAIHVRSDGSVLMSFSSSSLDVPGLTGGPDGETIDDSDIIVFTPTSTGSATAGTFSFYFDGSDVGLTSNGEDIDAVHEFPDGTLGISTIGSFRVCLSTGADEDVHRFTGSFGATTSGTWDRYFDGSDIGLSSSAEDIGAVSFDAADLIFSTKGTNSPPGTDDEDLNRFVGTYGTVTSGTAALELDLSSLGISASEDVDALHVMA